MPSGRQQVIHVFATLTLGTLASLTAFLANSPILSTNAQGFRLKQLKLSFSWRGKTAGNGPISVGLSQGLTVAQIAEAIVAAPTSSFAEAAVEQANRKVYPVGVIPVAATASGTLEGGPDPINHIQGNPWRDFPEGDSLDFYAFNHQGGALDAGTVISVVGVMVGEWSRD